MIFKITSKKKVNIYIYIYPPESLKEVSDKAIKYVCFTEWLNCTLLILIYYLIQVSKDIHLHSQLTISFQVNMELLVPSVTIIES